MCVQPSARQAEETQTRRRGPLQPCESAAALDRCLRVFAVDSRCFLSSGSRRRPATTHQDRTRLFTQVKAPEARRAERGLCSGVLSEEFPSGQLAGGAAGTLLLFFFSIIIFLPHTGVCPSAETKPANGVAGGSRIRLQLSVLPDRRGEEVAERRARRRLRRYEPRPADLDESPPTSASHCDVSSTAEHIVISDDDEAVVRSLQMEEDEALARRLQVETHKHVLACAEWTEWTGAYASVPSLRLSSTRRRGSRTADTSTSTISRTTTG